MTVNFLSFFSEIRGGLIEWVAKNGINLSVKLFGAIEVIAFKSFSIVSAFCVLGHLGTVFY